MDTLQDYYKIEVHTLQPYQTIQCAVHKQRAGTPGHPEYMPRTKQLKQKAPNSSSCTFFTCTCTSHDLHMYGMLPLQPQPTKPCTFVTG
jgi:hypothetical protein